MKCGMGVAIEDVVNERKRQQEKLGWTPSRDDERASGELADAAACYALSASGMPRSLCETYWPWDDGFKPKGARNDLVRAAALLVAEIERLDRVAGSYAAIGIFQGDADWSVSVRVSGFHSKELAEHYANNFRIRLMDARLYRDHADGLSPDNKPWIEVTDAEVSLSRLKPEVRNRIDQAHREYQAKGMDHIAIAQQSIKDFAECGQNPLVTSDEDYEAVKLPIAQWHQEMGLTCGFGSLAYNVE